MKKFLLHCWLVIYWNISIWNFRPSTAEDFFNSDKVVAEISFSTTWKQGEPRLYQCWNNLPQLKDKIFGVENGRPCLHPERYFFNYSYDFHVRELNKLYLFNRRITKQPVNWLFLSVLCQDTIGFMQMWKAHQFSYIEFLLLESNSLTLNIYTSTSDRDLKKLENWSG